MNIENWTVKTLKDLNENEKNLELSNSDATSLLESEWNTKGGFGEAEQRDEAKRNRAEFFEIFESSQFIDLTNVQSKDWNL